MLTPSVIKESRENLVLSDVFTELLAKRIIFYSNEVNAQTASIVVAQLMYLFSQDPTEPITIWLDNPGGEVYSGSSIIDTMDLIKNSGGTIKTICCGLCASYGAVILANGSPGHRSALKRSTIMIHQPLGGTGKGSVQASDIQIVANEISRLKIQLAEVFVEASGKTLDEVIKDLDRDNWLTPEQCLPGAYGPKGLIDNIIKDLAQ